MEITIMWNGGWDILEVDPTIMREATEQELFTYNSRVAAGQGGDPFIGNYEWLWCLFAVEFSSDYPRNMLVKIIRRVRHGD